MQLQSQDRRQAIFLLDEHEAGRLLEGLEAQPALGEEARDLAQALRSAGVTPPPGPDHVRMEYAPPL
jgi:hypothetical protein